MKTQEEVWLLNIEYNLLLYFYDLKVNQEDNKMVVSPKDVQTRANEREARLALRVKDLETQIDMMLETSAPLPGQKVQYALPMTESQEVIEALIGDYTRAGWEVTRWQGVSQDACNDLVFRYKR